MPTHNELEQFYRGNRFVVTGACGMIGSQLVKQLVSLGAYVAAFDTLEREDDRGVFLLGSGALEMTARKERARFHESVAYNTGPFAGDVANPSGVFSPRARYATGVFNLAAHVAGIQHNVGHQNEMLVDNLICQTAPLRLIEDGSGPLPKHFLQVSSVCVYPEDKMTPAVEENGWAGEPQAANYGYAWAKRMGELAARQSGIEHVVIVRPTNAYGPFDLFGARAHVIPSLVDKALTQETIQVYGPPHVTREFIHAEDAARGMLYVMAFGEHRGIYNIGTGGKTCVSLQELARIIRDLAREDNHVKTIVYHSDVQSGDEARFTDNSRLAALGWQFDRSLKGGLKEVIEWRKHQLSLSSE